MLYPIKSINKYNHMLSLYPPQPPPLLPSNKPFKVKGDPIVSILIFQEKVKIIKIKKDKLTFISLITLICNKIDNKLISPLTIILQSVTNKNKLDLSKEVNPNPVTYQTRRQQDQIQ